MNKNNYRFCAGGLLLLIATVLSIAMPMINHIFVAVNAAKYAWPDSILQSMLTTAIISTVTTLVLSIPVIILEIFLLLKKKGTGLMVLSIITLVTTVLSTVIMLIGNIVTSVTGINTTISFHSLIAVVVDILFMILIISTRKEPNGGFAKVWFLPGIAYCVYTLAYILYTFLYNSSLNPYLEIALLLSTVGGVLLRNMPAHILRIVGYFLAGHWLAKPYKKGFAPVQQPYYYPPQYPQQ